MTIADVGRLSSASDRPLHSSRLMIARSRALAHWITALFILESKDITTKTYACVVLIGYRAWCALNQVCIIAAIILGLSENFNLNLQITELFPTQSSFVRHICFFRTNGRIKKHSMLPSVFPRSAKINICTLVHFRNCILACFSACKHRRASCLHSHSTMAVEYIAHSAPRGSARPRGAAEIFWP